MTDDSLLLAAIAAHPGEDTPRLAYADWLEEAGEARLARFIREQIRGKIAVTPPAPWLAQFEPFVGRPISEVARQPKPYQAVATTGFVR